MTGPTAIGGRTRGGVSGWWSRAAWAGVVLAAACPARGAKAALPEVPGIEPPPPAREPRVAGAGDEAGTAAASFGLPPGFAAELFAAEPLVANPVAFSVDPATGVVYACEAFRAHKGVGDNVRINDDTWLDADLASRTVADRFAFMHRLLGARAPDWVAETDRVRRIVDADGDGRAEAATVFADGFNRLVDGHAAGVLARRGDVWLACIPALWRLRDADGDGVADERRPLHTGYGVRVAIQGHDLHGLVMGPDGRLWFSIGDRGYAIDGGGPALQNPESGAVFRCEPDGSGLEVVHTGLRNPQELAFDDLGNLFTVDNNTDGGDRTRLVWIVPGGDSGWRGPVQYLPDRGPFNREQWWRTAFPGQAAFIVPPLAHIGAGPAGFAADPGTLPEPYRGRFFLADFRGAAATSAVRSFRIEPAGSAFVAVDEEETFRHVLATDVEIGPDGAIWVSDWVHGWEGLGKGRLWRFVPRSTDAAAAAAREHAVAEVRGLLAGDWTALSAARLAELLVHADRRIRLEAQWELARRGDATTLGGAVASAGPWTGVVHGLWGLEQIARRLAGADPRRGAIERDIAAALDDPRWEVRMVAARCVGEVAWGAAAPCARLLDMLTDDHPHVRGAAATALGRVAGRTPDLADRSAALERVVAAIEAEAARGSSADPHARHPLVMALFGTADRGSLAAMLRHSDRSVRLAAVLALRRHGDPAIAAALDDAEPAVVVEAARAIHDLPIPAATPALAARLTTGPRAGVDGDAFLRRAIAAAERDGSTTSAEGLAAVAADAEMPGPRRLEALETLAGWETPRPRDRVIGSWRPFARRDPAPARAALARSLPTILATSDEAVRTRALEAAATVGIDGVAELLAATAADGTRPPGSRGAALEALAHVDAEAAAANAARLAADPAPAVRTAARRVRARTGATAGLASELAAVTAARAADEETLREQQAALALLPTLDDADATAALATIASAVERDGVDPRLRLDALAAVGDRVPAQVRAAIESSGSDLRAGGDPRRGRDIFFHRAAVECVRCHRVGDVGGEVGPRLDGIGRRRDAAYLLESLRDPGARIADGYRTTVVVTGDGRTEAGILRSETADELVLLRPDGSLARLPMADVEARRDGASAMPADLAARLTRQDLRDLVAWLGSLVEEPAPSP
jgi:quinoprotein glucose dehydrogenase